MEMPKSGSDKL